MKEADRIVAIQRPERQLRSTSFKALPSYLQIHCCSMDSLANQAMKRWRCHIRSLGTQVRSLSILVTDSCCWDFTGVTLAFEDANSKLLDFVSIADIDADERVDDSLVKIWKLNFGQDFELNFGQDFEAEIWSSF